MSTSVSTHAACQNGCAGASSVKPAVQVARQCTCSTVQQLQGPDLSSLHPLMQQQWDHAKNLPLGNIVITPGSGKKVWWKCDKCPAGHSHQWAASPNSRTTGLRSTSGAGCPFCSGHSVCPHNSLAVNERVVAAQWSDKNPDQPEAYTVSSGAKKVWRCHRCGNEWIAAIFSRTNSKSGCPCCFHQKQRGTKKGWQPAVTESQHAMKYWDWATNQEAGLDAQTLTCASAKKAHWICHKCPRSQPHRWTALVYNVCKGSGCPYCRGYKPCICNSIQSLHPDIAAEWDYSKNEGTPDDFQAQSNKKAWWHNSKRGSFEAYIYVRTRKQLTDKLD